MRKRDFDLSILRPRQCDYVGVMSNSNSHQNRLQPQLPGRVDSHEAAEIIGFSDHDIPILVKAGLLNPLGQRQEHNTPRYFAAVEIQRLANDVEWLSKATDATRNHWREKNARRANRGDSSDRAA